MAAQQRHIGFLMILMQRLVTSSTAAIRTTLEKRLAALNAPQAQASLFEGLAVSEQWAEWAELDGQSQADMTVQAAAESLDGLAREKSEVDMLLDLARETEARGRRHRRQGRGSAGADLRAPARGGRSDHQGTGLHRVRTGATHAGQLLGRARFHGRPAQRRHGPGRPNTGPVRVLSGRADPDLHRCRAWV